MKRIEDIKEFEDIDTYYEISNIVAEVFQDRVEAHKHLVTANKEIERLHNIINELEKWLVEWREMLDCPDFYEEGIIDCINDTLTELQELKGSDKDD